MTAGHQTRKYIVNPVNVPAAQTAAQVAQFTINDEMRLNLRADVLLGKVVVSGTTTLALEDSMGYGVWNTAKTSSGLTSSTNKTTTAATATGILTSAAHGFLNGQMVVLNSSGTVPGGLLPGRIYWVANKTTNTFQVSDKPGDAVPVSSFSDAGSGTITTTAVTVVSLALNVNVAGDQAVMPLRPQGRLACTTDTSDTVQVSGLLVAHLY